MRPADKIDKSPLPDRRGATFRCLVLVLTLALACSSEDPVPPASPPAGPSDSLEASGSQPAAGLDGSRVEPPTHGLIADLRDESRAAHSPATAETMKLDPPFLMRPLAGGRRPTQGEEDQLRGLRDSVFQLGGVGYSGEIGDTERLARRLSHDKALLRSLTGDRSAVVRAYAAYFLASTESASVDVIEHLLRDEGTMYCQSGCVTDVCTVWSEIGRKLVFSGTDWPEAAFSSVIAGGREPTASRARMLVTERRSEDERARFVPVPPSGIFELGG